MSNTHSHLKDITDSENINSQLVPVATPGTRGLVSEDHSELEISSMLSVIRYLLSVDTRHPLSWALGMQQSTESLGSWS